MTTSRASVVAITLTVAFGLVGTGSTQRAAKDQNPSGTAVSVQTYAGRQRVDDHQSQRHHLLSGGTSGFGAVLGGNRSAVGQYERLEAHGFYWTLSENDAATAPFYNFGKGSQALYRQRQGEKQMAISARCVRE